MAAWQADAADSSGQGNQVDQAVQIGDAAERVGRRPFDGSVAAWEDLGCNFWGDPQHILAGWSDDPKYLERDSADRAYVVVGEAWIIDSCSNAERQRPGYRALRSFVRGVRRGDGDPESSAR